MPSRSLTVAIVVSWLVMSGTFLVGDVWPRLFPPEPTLFPIELIDEAGQQADSIGWTVFKNDEETYIANTEWVYDASADSFRSSCTLNRKGMQAETPRAGRPAWPPHFHDLRMDSTAHVSRSERVERLLTKPTFTFVPPGGAGKMLRAEGDLAGDRAGSHLTLSAAVTVTPSDLPPGEKDPAAPAPTPSEQAGVPLSPRGNVLNPLHPLRRVRDVRPGQAWPIPVIDPFAVAALPDLPDARPADPDAHAALAHVLAARVLPGTRALRWENEDHECRVIEARGDGPVTALTVWVRAGDNFVLQQEVTVRGDEWLFVRRLHPHRVPSRPAFRRKP